MTTATIGIVKGRRRSAARELAAIEIRWMLQRVSLWLALVASILLNSRSTEDWSAGAYMARIVSVMPIGIVAFVTGLRTGSRDTALDGRIFSSAAPVGGDVRALARLAALVVPAAMAAALAIGVAIGSRIEGGYWIGESIRRTDTALHPWTELLQLPLTIAVLGCCGILIGARTPRRFMAPVVIAASAVVLLGSIGWWAWNIPPMHAATILQTQPLYVDLPDVTTFSNTPPDWLVEAPGEFDDWQRLVVHRPTIIAHDIYLVALAVFLGGLAVRGRRAFTVAAIAAAGATASVVFQIAVHP